MAAKPAASGAAASKNITKKIRELGDWRGEMLAYIRRLIHAADPQIHREGEKLNEAAFKEMIRSAVAANSIARARRKSSKK